MNEIIIEQKKQVGNNDKEIIYVVREFDNQEILVPPFQRGYVWNDDKLKNWIKTIISQNAIGVIVTYQVNGADGAVYLADGFQRITSTSRFLKNPQKYGFEFGEKQAESYCKNFKITIQHRIYKSHEEARAAFQNLNEGTSVTPAEYHKGEMTLDSVGKFTYEKVPLALSQIETRYLSQKTLPRLAQSKMIRDSLGMFYQYISDYKGLSFWAVTKQNKAGQSIESILLEFIKQYKLDEKDIENKIKQFQSFLQSELLLFEQCQQKTYPTEIYPRFSPTTLRWLLHLSIWIRNNHWSRDNHFIFLKKFFDLLKPYGFFTSKFALPETNPVKQITLNTSDLGHFNSLCKYFDIPIEPIKRKQNNNAPIGANASHIKPFSLFGEGETIIESAVINKARGNRELVLEK